MSERVRPEADDYLYRVGAVAAPPYGALLPGCDEPAPFVGPYLGLVSGVLCALVGAFLLLAPFAFDYRHGAASLPRSAVLDLATGAAVVGVGLLTSGLFGLALVRRLRARPAASSFALGSGYLPSADDEFDEDDDLDLSERVATPILLHLLEQEPEPEPEYEPEPEPRPAAPTPPLDPSGALRDLLTPLVAALAADLRARDRGEGLGTDREKD
ncbi:hypothetical protein KDL01_03525 [Actinospica durhamensis]|uniref:Uncharacterized protein n=1 Tax=Actinospica durhamensis TaxID=1508375 RepID=A0A941EJE4_9ACTN|nr:hypothetical protein [Actinospica durhamensis]MBR7832311.1 hypothetical protein [Actinospica durhamensis]